MKRIAGFIGIIAAGVWIGVVYTTIYPTGVAASTPLDRGKDLYQGHCASCHGMDGGGNGPEATGMTPPPTNFRDANVIELLSDSDLEQAILIGKPNSEMRGYGTVFDAQDISGLIRYLRSFSEQ